MYGAELCTSEGKMRRKAGDTEMKLTEKELRWEKGEREEGVREMDKD